MSDPARQGDTSKEEPADKYPALVTVRPCCPKCGSGKVKAYGNNPNKTAIEHRGTIPGTGQRYQAYQRLRRRCDDCGQVFLTLDYLLEKPDRASKSAFKRRLRS